MKKPPHLENFLEKIKRIKKKEMSLKECSHTETVDLKTLEIFDFGPYLLQVSDKFKFIHITINKKIGQIKQKSKFKSKKKQVLVI